jgi:hypothetical protein
MQLYFRALSTFDCKRSTCATAPSRLLTPRSWPLCLTKSASCVAAKAHPVGGRFSAGGSPFAMGTCSRREKPQTTGLCGKPRRMNTYRKQVRGRGHTVTFWDLLSPVAAAFRPASLVFRVPRSTRFVQRVGFAFAESPVRDDTLVAQCGTGVLSARRCCACWGGGSTGNHCRKQIEAPEGATQRSQAE